jgi:DNA-binding transcriptional regulator YhcF (GntR family)
VGIEISIDRDSDVPVGTQLAWALRTAIATGELAAGSKLPSVRELAALAGVNVNTVRHVYARLEAEALIGSEHGRGTFVARDAPSHAGLAQIAADAIAAAKRSGIDPRDLVAALHVAPLAGNDQAAADDSARRAAGRVRSALREEIAALETELAHLDPLGATATSTARRTKAPGRPLSATELETTRDELLARVTALRDARAARHRDVEAERARAREAPLPRPEWRHSGTWTLPGRRPVLRNGL